MSHGACAVCGQGALADRGRFEGRRVVECGDCGLIQVRLSGEEAAEYDASYRRLGRYHRERQLRGFGTARQRFEHDLRIAETRLAFLTRVAKGGRLLDVGCSTGGFLLRAKESGFESVGIDVDEWVVRRARSWTRCQVLHGDLRNLWRRLGLFSVVCMIDVLEHLSRPLEYFRVVGALVDEGGCVFVEIPDGDSATFAGPTWWTWKHFKPREHVTYPGRRHIELLAREVGMRIGEEYEPLPDRKGYILTRGGC